MPFAVLAAGSMLVSLMRNRDVRLVWIAEVTVVLLSLVSMIALLVSGRWQSGFGFPGSGSLLGYQFMFELDAANGAVVVASLCLLLGALLTGLGNANLGQRRYHAMMIGSTALAMLAFMAGNLLIVVISWSLLDAVLLARLLRDRISEEAWRTMRSRMPIAAMSSLVLLGSAVMVMATDQASGRSQPLRTSEAEWLLVGAILLRVVIRPRAIEPKGDEEGPHRLVLFLGLLEGGIALFLLARGPFLDMSRLWGAGIEIIAAIGLLWAVLALARSGGRSSDWSLFMLAGCSMILVVGRLSSEVEGLDRLGLVIAFMLGGGAIWLIDAQESWHQWIPIGVGLLVAGLPWMVGADAAGTLAQSLFSGARSTAIVITILGEVILVASLVRLGRKWVRRSNGGPGLDRLVHELGVGVLVVAVMALGVWMGWAVNVEGAGIFLVISALGITIGMVDRGWSYMETGLAAEGLGVNPVARLVKSAAGAGRATLSLTRVAFDALEGDGGLLWLYVLMILLVIGLVGTIG